MATIKINPDPDRPGAFIAEAIGTGKVDNVTTIEKLPNQPPGPGVEFYLLTVKQEIKPGTGPARVTA